MNKILITICLVFALGLMFMNGCEDKPKQKIAKQEVKSGVSSEVSSEVNVPAYDYMNDASLPVELRAKIKIMVDSLNTGDINSYCATYDRQGMYDLFTGKSTISDNYGRFNSWHAEDINDLEKSIAGVKELQIKDFEDFCKRMVPESFSDYFEEPIRKFTITSAVIDSNALHVEVYYDVKQNNGEITRCGTDWVYYNQTWWQQDGSPDSDLIFISDSNNLQGTEPNQPAPYDYMSDANIPVTLKEEIGRLIIALDTNDVNEYLAGIPLKTYYDLMCNKVSLCELPEMLTEISLRELREEQKEFKRDTIEEFKKVYLETSCRFLKISDKQRKFNVSSVEVDEPNGFAVTNINYQNKSWYDPKSIEWVYFESKWWHCLEH